MKKQIIAALVAAPFLLGISAFDGINAMESDFDLPPDDEESVSSSGHHEEVPPAVEEVPSAEEEASGSHSSSSSDEEVGNGSAEDSASADEVPSSAAFKVTADEIAAFDADDLQPILDAISKGDISSAYPHLFTDEVMEVFAGIEDNLSFMKGFAALFNSSLDLAEVQAKK